MDSDYGSDIELTPDDEELLRILDSTPLPPPSAAPPPTTNFVNELQNSQGGRDGNNEDDAGGNAAAAVILYPTLPVLSDSSNSVHYDCNETGGFYAPASFRWQILTNRSIQHHNLLQLPSHPPPLQRLYNLPAKTLRLPPTLPMIVSAHERKPFQLLTWFPIFGVNSNMNTPWLKGSNVARHRWREERKCTKFSKSKYISRCR
jgi:hypothetical protein